MKVMEAHTDKQLLRIDLSARLCYGLCVKDTVNNQVIYDIDYHPDLTNCRPYLRPMSSMTEEEWESFRATMIKEAQRNYPDSCDFSVTNHYSYTPRTFDWLNENKFDYRGLIPKGLALEAPKGMYNK